MQLSKNNIPKDEERDPNGRIAVLSLPALPECGGRAWSRTRDLVLIRDTL